jgi:hypothetical protein
MNLAARPASIQRQVILSVLRGAGPCGVPYIVLRDLLGGENAESVLSELRARGHVISRRPGHDGQVIAHLWEPNLLDQRRVA